MTAGPSEGMVRKFMMITGDSTFSRVQDADPVKVDEFIDSIEGAVLVWAEPKYEERVGSQAVAYMVRVFFVTYDMPSDDAKVDTDLAERFGQ